MSVLPGFGGDEMTGALKRFVRASPSVRDLRRPLEDKRIVFPVHISVDEWVAIVHIVRDHAESLEKWDEETREFYWGIVQKLESGPLTDEQVSSE